MEIAFKDVNAYVPSGQIEVTNEVQAYVASGNINVLTTHANPIAVELVPNNAGTTDSFNRLRVSNNHILFSSQAAHLDGENNVFWTQKTVGDTNVSFDKNAASVYLRVNGTAGASVVRQSRRCFLYRAGQGHLIYMTFANAGKQTGIIKRIGYFKDNDGIFFESSETDLSFVIKSSTDNGIVSEDRVTQQNWNLDKLDGTGTSGLILDPDKGQILYIDLQWLGVGRVRVGFVINGLLHFVHQFQHANIVLRPYMHTATLPVRYEISNTGNYSGSLTQICAAVIREGGEEEEGTGTAASTEGFSASCSAQWSNVLSVRVRPSNPHATIRILNIELWNWGNQAIAWQARFNPYFSTSLGWSHHGEISQKSTTPAVLASGGHVMSAGFVATSARGQASNTSLLTSNIGLGRDVDLIPDTFSIIASSQTGTQALSVVVDYLELF